MDRYNQILVENLHPPDWVNPQPAPRYNLVVIGGGTAGLVTAAGAAIVGAKVALIEKHLLGGDCTNVGCVPSKSMIRSARSAADVRSAQAYGVEVPEGTQVNFAAVMERLRRVRSEISSNDSADRFRQEFGVDVFLGEARFSEADTVSVGDQTLRFQKAVIATGSRPATLSIDGLEEAKYLTNETVFQLTDRPGRVAVIGGGYIGCELAQTFCRLGSQVTLLQSKPRLLDREDPDAAAIVEQTLAQEGVQLVLSAKVLRVERQADEKVLHYEADGQLNTVTVDEILVAAGRTPNTEGLNLAAIGVTCDPKSGVIVNDYLQTTNPRIYAVGDVCMQWKFTHAADAAARIVVQNSLFAVWRIGARRLSKLIMPWCTYTDPEVAHVGMDEQAAQAKGIAVETLHVPLHEIDRAIVDGETAGFAKIHVREGTDQILGATVVARHAGDMLSQITTAMVGKIGLNTLANVIHPYPTQAEVIRKAADAYSLRRLHTPLVKKLFSTWLTWTR
jgi:pyruvate/2-oxoglutarate dehydrogenase complex dihydrolipoamide dehydrogenase (E3) component